MGFFSSKSSSKVVLPWIELTNLDQLNAALRTSANRPILFFKHSTRCGVSSMALSTFEKTWKLDTVPCDLYLLDLLSFREISNKVEELAGVTHQSPQAIVMVQQGVVYQASHSSIDAEEIQRILREEVA
jgi:bacillithiol system protein YtxJ